MAFFNITHISNLSLTLSFHSPAEPSHSDNQNSSQPEQRNEYNEPLNDPLSTWSNYNTSRPTSMLIVPSNLLSFLVGQQPAFPNDDDPRLCSYPAPQQVPQRYQPYMDPPMPPHRPSQTLFVSIDPHRSAEIQRPMSTPGYINHGYLGALLKISLGQQRHSAATEVPCEIGDSPFSFTTDHRLTY